MNWTDGHGKRHRPRIGKVAHMSERAANLILKAKELELATGRKSIVGRSAHAVRLGVLAQRYLGWHGAKFPASAYNARLYINQQIVPFFGTNTVLEEIDVAWGERFIEHRQGATPTPAPATIIKEINQLKAMFAKAVDWKMIDENPVRKLSRPENLRSKAKPYFRVEELQQLYATPSSYTPIWRFMVNVGTRRAEMLNLKVEHIRDERVLIESTEVRRTKSKKWRAVPLGIGSKKALEAITPTDGYLCPRITGHSLSRAFKQDLKRAKINRGTLHWLRHTFITQLIQQGRPLRVVQKLAGHSSIVTTEGYAHVDPEFAQRATADLDL